MTVQLTIPADTDLRRPIVGKTTQLRHALAGASIQTVQWGAHHLAFQVRASDDLRCWFVDALVGSERCPVFIGTIQRRDHWFSPSSRFHPTDSQHTRCFAWWWRRLHQDRALPARLQVWSSGRCARCGRLLTDPESIARGIGPVCWEHCKTIVDLSDRLGTLADALEADGWSSPAWTGCPDALRSMSPRILTILLRLLMVPEAAQVCQVIELMLGGGLGDDAAVAEIASLAGQVAIHVGGTEAERKQLREDLANIAAPKLAGWWVPDAPVGIGL